MSNYKNLYDYFLGGGNIEVWPTEGADKITIEADDFFGFLRQKDYIAAHAPGEIALNGNGYEPEELIWEGSAEWWNDPRVISQPGKFTAITNLLDALLCEYLNDPANVRLNDCRTVADGQ